MCDELTLKTKQNDAESTRNENADQTLSMVNENDKNKTAKQNVEERDDDEVFKKSKADKKEDLIQINTGFKIEPQTVWVQYIGNSGGGGGGFDYDPYSRNSFVRLVFTIVFIMLLITSIFTGVVYMVESLRETFLRHNTIILICGMVVMIAMSYAINCSACTRVPPCNFICLFIVVVAMSLVCAAVTARYKTELVVFALLGTLVTVFVCTMLAYSNFDFTKYYIYIIAIAVAFAVISMIVSISMFVMKVHIPVLSLVMLFVGTLINVAILIMELQMILGGRSIEMGESDYALAAFLLYTSIVDMFLRCVQMCGIMDELLG